MSAYRPLHNETPEQAELRIMRIEYVRACGEWARANQRARRAENRLAEWHTAMLLTVLAAAWVWAFWAVLL